MTQMERLIARVKQLCKENPGKVVEIKIISDRNGEPFMWFVGAIHDVEGNDEKLVVSGIKPTTRN